MTWNYQILKHIEEDGSVWFGLHEVYRDKEGYIDGWTQNPSVVGDTVHEVIVSLKMMMRDGMSRSVHTINEECDEKTPSKLEDAINVLLDSADDTGCDGDLTVVSKKAIETITRLFRG